MTVNCHFNCAKVKETSFKIKLTNFKVADMLLSSLVFRFDALILMQKIPALELHVTGADPSKEVVAFQYRS